MSKALHNWISLLWVMVLGGCATLPPNNTANLCQIFAEKDDWYGAALAAARRWHISIPIAMAIIHQESSFVEDARPARVRFLGIPLWRPSSAYGYGQAKDETWDWYVTKTGNHGADRDEFEDAIDFVAWYMHQSQLEVGIAWDDAYNHYLAYHEGHGGYRRGSWRDKPWLQSVARKVSMTSWRYRRQLDTCRTVLQRLVVR